MCACLRTLWGYETFSAKSVQRLKNSINPLMKLLSSCASFLLNHIVSSCLGGIFIMSTETTNQYHAFYNRDVAMGKYLSARVVLET